MVGSIIYANIRHLALRLRIHARLVMCHIAVYFRQLQASAAPAIAPIPDYRDRCVVRLEGQFEAFVGGGKAESLVEADRVGAAFVGGQLDEAAAAAAGLFDRPADHRPAQALTAPGSANTHALDLGAEHAVPAQARYQGQLQRPGDLPLDVGHDQSAARVGRDVVERVP